MSTTRKQGGSGYRLERVYVAEQEYKIEEPRAAGEPEEEERGISFGWDWRPMTTRRFEVVLEVRVGPVPQASESARVRLIGVFEAMEGEQSISFPNFIRFNAPAILFPFAREVISTMTGRGPYGAFHLDPLNVAALLGNADLSKTTGAAILDANPSIAAEFGLDYLGPSSAEDALGSK